MKISEYKLSSDSIYLVVWEPSGYCYTVKRIKLPLDKDLLMGNIEELRSRKDAIIYAGKDAMELMTKRCEEAINVRLNLNGRLLYFMDIQVKEIWLFPRNNYSVNPYQKEQLVST